MTFKRTRVCAGVLAAMGGALALTALPAGAQERVEVTGSRIKTTETDTASPVISLGAAEIKIEAVRNVESLLNNLPQVFADYGGQVSNGSTGTATVNLRNLGRDRTLVLINGRRMPAGSPRANAADLNQIPVSLIKRVEVLTGGASAVYGSDAVAGVVNFIMNDSFEGVQVEANHQFYNHKQKGKIDYALNDAGYAIPGNKSADGKSTDINITIGGNFANGKGNATAFFGFKRDDALLQSERDFSACSLAPDGDVFFCGGSSTSFAGRFRGLGITPNSDRDWTLDRSSGAVRKFNTATDLYNFGPLNYFQRPSDRFSAAAFARYEITPAAKAYLEATFHDDRTVAQIAPSGLFTVDQEIFSDNPLLTSDWLTALQIPTGGSRTIRFNRRNVEGGGRQDDLRHTSFRFVTGVKGDIGPWSYDAFAQAGRVVYQETYKNDFSIVRAQRSLDVVTDPATGQAVCRSALDGTDPNCVPYNIWRLGGVTPEALAYVQTPGFQKGFTSQNVVGASATADLGEYGVKFPGAKSGVSIVVGAERRLEKLELSTDTAFSTGDLAGQGGPTIGVSGGFSAKDVFSELRVPIMEKQPLAEVLTLTGSARRTSYSHAPTTNTFGSGLEWAPVREVKLRGSIQRAVRAPNVVDFTQPVALGLYNDNVDPCAGATPQASATECARTGVTSAQYGNIDDNPAGQYNALFGTKNKLVSEKSRSVTFGVVVNPIKDLNLTLDYFNVELSDAIGGAPSPLVLRQCLATGDAQWCNRVHRDSSGSLWETSDGFIDAFNENLAKLRTRGFDFGADYAVGLPGMGKAAFSFIGTLLSKSETEPIPGLSYDCKGLYGATCGTPTPKWRHKLRGTWNTPWNADVSLTWRYIGAVEEDVTSTQAVLATLSTGGANPVQAKLGAQNYIDLNAAYQITKNLQVRFSVNNLFDKDPPITAQGAPFGNGNTYPVVYDALGRRIGLNLTASF